MTRPGDMPPPEPKWAHIDATLSYRSIMSSYAVEDVEATEKLFTDMYTMTRPQMTYQQLLETNRLLMQRMNPYEQANATKRRVWLDDMMRRYQTGRLAGDGAHQYWAHNGDLIQVYRDGGIETTVNATKNEVLSARDLRGVRFDRSPDYSIKINADELFRDLFPDKEEKDMNQNITVTEADRRVAQAMHDEQVNKEFEEKQALAKQLIPFDSNGQQSDGTVIKFEKKFNSGPGGTGYAYAGIKAKGMWYLTGPTQSARAFTWQELVLWLISGTPIEPTTLIVFDDSTANSVMDYNAPKAVDTAAPGSTGYSADEADEPATPVEDIDEALREH